MIIDEKLIIPSDLQSRRWLEKEKGQRVSAAQATAPIKRVASTMDQSKPNRHNHQRQIDVKQGTKCSFDVRV